MIEQRTQQFRSEESRRRLLTAAIELLAIRGYAGTTLAAIGEEAGLSRGLVTHHFGSKEQCIREVIAHIREQIVLYLAAAGETRGVAALDLLVATYLRGGASESFEPRAMYTVITEALTSAPGLRDDVAANNRQLREMIEDWLTEAVADGEATATDLPSCALLIEALLRGVLLQYLVDTEAFEVETIIRDTQIAVHQLINP